MAGDPPYNCSHYRDEMTLLALRRRLNEAALSEEQRRRISEEIRRFEKRMGMR